MTRKELLRILEQRLTVAYEMRRSADQRVDRSAFLQHHGRIRELQDIISILETNLIYETEANRA